ncbi:MAG TPA: GntR family transcriptional regulator [Thermoleophilaceae bacterium]|jgi:GntR family phosphonate transport system transcriptional regulator|nr:GntR family transcriptional regulator [Thermoleophilaceae bacterium]
MPENLDVSVDRSAGVPVGAQLASRIRSAVRDGTLQEGDRLPSVRELADSAGVNVNTARTLYARLESEGIVRSEQGRGTFVAAAPRLVDAATRRELHRQIAQLEAALVRLPLPPTLANPPTGADQRPAAAALLSTEDLHAVRDELIARLGELDAQRAAVVDRLHQLGVEEAPAASVRRATPSLARARIRWVGA